MSKRVAGTDRIGETLRSFTAGLELQGIRLRELLRFHRQMYVGFLLAAVIAIAAGTNAWAASSAEFRAVLSALRSGKEVTMVADLSQCIDNRSGKAGPPIIAGLDIRSFMIAANKTILFSDVHDSVDPNGRETTEYIKYALDAGGTLHITVSSVSLGKVAQRDTISCRLPSSAVFRSQ